MMLCGDRFAVDPACAGAAELIPGSKIHAMCERGGLPLTTAISAANTADTAILLRHAGGGPARPARHRPDKVHADKA